MTIACLGIAPALDVTILVEAMSEGAIHRPTAVLQRPGGKSLNLARVLASLGTDAHAIVPLGGPIGRMLEELAHDAGLAVELVAGPPTRVCTTIVDAGGTATEFYPHPPSLADEHWASIGSALSAGPWDAVVYSGSVPVTQVQRLSAVLDAATRNGARLVVDTHGAALSALVADHSPALVKVNRDEAYAVTGCSDPEDAASALVARGAHTAVVTDGTRGIAAADGSRGEVHFVPHRGAVGRYPTGSGDSFLAGMVHLRDAPLREAIEFGMRCARANAVIPGAGDLDPATLAD